ncbi:MAG: glycosyltransferase [Candidatus Eisenbacteria bacterium]|nr:glycosyltransferase [Candidatus Eisenbacteria bacterium]
MSLRGKAGTAGSPIRRKRRPASGALLTGSLHKNRRTLALMANGASWGGTERHVLDLASGFAVRGLPVTVVLGYEGAAADRFRNAGLSVAVVPRRAGAVSFLRRLVRYLRATRPRLAHLHGGRMPSVACRAADVPVVVETRHGIGYPVASPFRIPASERLRELLTGRFVDATITVCRRDAAFYERVRGADRLIRAVPNGIRVPESQGPEDSGALPEPGDSSIRLGFVGRLAAQKGLPGFLRALAQVRTDFQLELAGEGPDEPELRRLARKLDLADRVRFAGFVSEMKSSMLRWDVVVLPSVWEGLPYAALEALALGRPVLATAVGGLPELIREGEWGWLAEPGSIPAMTAALRRIPKDREQLREMGRRGRRHVIRNHDLDEMVTGVLGVYDEVGG